MFIEIENHVTYVEVEPHQGWKKTMAKDIESIKKNETWVNIPNLVNKELIPTKWIYKSHFSH